MSHLAAFLLDSKVAGELGRFGGDSGLAGGGRARGSCPCSVGLRHPEVAARVDGEGVHVCGDAGQPHAAFQQQRREQ